MDEGNAVGRTEFAPMADSAVRDRDGGIAKPAKFFQVLLQPHQDRPAAAFCGVARRP
jgi:hypothetical protein